MLEQTSYQHNQVFTFRRMKNIHNKMVNKNIPGLSVSQKNNVVECRDAQAESSIVRSEHPLEFDHCLPYFEVQVLATATEDTINIGLIGKDNANKHTIGKSMNSFGYLRGDLFLNKRKVQSIVPVQKLKANDYIGIGVNCHKNTFLVVKNDKVVSENIPIPERWNEYYPAIGVNNQGQKVRIKYNPKDFRFNYFQKVKQIQNQIDKEIKKEEINSSQIYPLVNEYLEFNGYTKSLAMLQEREKQFSKLPKLTKNPGIPHPTINLEVKMVSKIMNQDDDMNEPLKFRPRVMSERIDERQDVPEEARRKNTEMMVEPMRKGSYISNISNISNYNKSEEGFFCEEEQRFFNDQPQTQNQRFLLNQKVEIIRLVKNKEIQKAIQIIENFIPELLNQGYILAFLKAHIFLRIVKEQSSLEGIKYSQKEKTLFDAHLGTLFPFYNSEAEGVKWEILKNIFKALTYNVKNCKGKNYDILSDKQFQSFGDYLNNIILKNMGYLGCSRLGFCVNNSTKIFEKLKNYKAQTCGLQLTL